MVDIIPRQPSTSDRLFEALGIGAEGLARGMLSQHERKQINQRMQQENQALQQLTGMDFSGITDPMQRKEILSSVLQGRNQQMVQELKGSQKQQQQQQKLNEIEKIFGSQNQGQFSGLRDESNKPNFQGFDPLQISDSAIAQASIIDPNLARSLQHSKDVALREKRETEALNEAKRQKSPEFQRETELTKAQAQSDTKYYNNLQEQRSKQVLKKESLNRLKRINKEGVSGKAWERVAENIGLTSLTSEGRREFSAEVKNQFTDFKAIAGSQLSAQEFFVLAGAYPNADFSKEANDAIIQNLEDVHDTLDKEHDIAEELIKENGGKKPENFQAKVNGRMQAYISKKISRMKENLQKVMNAQYNIPQGHTLMFDLKTGDPLSVPDDQIARLLDEGLADLP